MTHVHAVPRTLELSRHNLTSSLLNIILSPHHFPTSWLFKFSHLASTMLEYSSFPSCFCGHFILAPLSIALFATCLFGEMQKALLCCLSWQPLPVAPFFSLPYDFDPRSLGPEKFLLWFSKALRFLWVCSSLLDPAGLAGACPYCLDFTDVLLPKDFTVLPVHPSSVLFYVKETTWIYWHKINSHH